MEITKKLYNNISSHPSHALAQRYGAAGCLRYSALKQGTNDTTAKIPQPHGLDLRSS